MPFCRPQTLYFRYIYDICTSLLGKLFGRNNGLYCGSDLRSDLRYNERHYPRDIQSLIWRLAWEWGTATVETVYRPQIESINPVCLDPELSRGGQSGLRRESQGGATVELSWGWHCRVPRCQRREAWVRHRRGGGSHRILNSQGHLGLDSEQYLLDESWAGQWALWGERGVLDWGEWGVLEWGAGGGAWGRGWNRQQWGRSLHLFLPDFLR